MAKALDQLEAMTELLRAAEADGLRLRLLGGLGVYASCPSANQPPFEREYSDADLVSLSDSAALQRFFAARGWLADREFNLYNGDRRLIFSSAQGMKADVFVGAFKMCHEFSFAGRLPETGLAVFPAELLLTKLQIHEINDKDLADAACVLLDHEVGDDDAGIDGVRIASACAADWGVYRSISANLGKTLAWAQSKIKSAEAERIVAGRVKRLLEAIERGEKSLAWRLRAAVGERLRWYEAVEEVELC